MLSTYSFPVGPIQANCHVLQDSESREIVVVDPGGEAETILDFLDTLKGKVVAIWNTHGHIDHIGACAAVRAATQAPVSIHHADKECLASEFICGAAMFGIPFEPCQADVLWSGGEAVRALGRDWIVHHAPGHSPGMCTITCADEKLVICGDLILMNSIGRTDLPGGDPRAMAESLRAFFQDYTKPEWEIFTGHGDRSTVQREISTNVYARELMRDFAP